MTKTLTRLLTLVLLFTSCAFAQSTVTFTAANISNSKGDKLASGSLCFLPTDNADFVLPGYKLQSGQSVKTQVCTPITNGAASMTIANTATTTPVNVCFRVTVLPSGSQTPILTYKCVQPVVNSTDAAHWCTSGTCNFDAYTPNLAPQIANVGVKGDKGDPGVGYMQGVSSDGDSGIVVQKKVKAQSVEADNLAVVTSLQDTRFASGYAEGSATGGIQEAYNACAANTGCKVVVDKDITLAAAATVTTVAGKPLFVDGHGHKVKCTLAVGTCLKLAPSNTSDLMSFENFYIDGTGAGAGVVGLRTDAATGMVLRNIHISNFTGTGSLGLYAYATEDSSFDNIYLKNNYNALKIENAANQVRFSSIWINANGAGKALEVQASAGVTFRDSLIQSNVGVQTILIGKDSNNIAFDQVWMENNGDGTANTRLFTFDSDATHWIIGVKIRDCRIAGGANGALGSEFKATNPGTFTKVILENNYHIGYAASADATLSSSGKFLGVEDNNTVANGLGQWGEYGARLTSGGLAGAMNPDTLNVSTWAKFGSWVNHLNGGDVAGYSDNGITEKWRIVGATGEARFTLFTLSGGANFGTWINFKNGGNYVGYSDNGVTEKWRITGATGVAKFSGYQSSDGSNGFTGSCASSATLTVKNGLVVGGC